MPAHYYSQESQTKRSLIRERNRNRIPSRRKPTLGPVHLGDPHHVQPAAGTVEDVIPHLHDYQAVTSDSSRLSRGVQPSVTPSGSDSDSFQLKVEGAFDPVVMDLVPLGAGFDVVASLGVVDIAQDALGEVTVHGQVPDGDVVERLL